MADDAPPNCNGEAVELSRRGLRIGAIFIILASSLFGSVLPVVLARQKRFHIPKFTFFICKYVGTGVIIATAWLHLLDPAIDNFSDECVAERVPEYPWALFIGLFTVFTMFFFELLATKASARNEENYTAGPSDSEDNLDELALKTPGKRSRKVAEACPHDVEGGLGPDQRKIPGAPDDVSYPPGGQDHLAHADSHKEGDGHGGISGQLLAIFILEFGVIFHSVFIGLTLGTVESNGLVILLVVLVFHQMFEGLGLGSRLAIAPWPSNRRWVPYALAIGFSISTPVGIAAGIGAKPANATDQKLTNGIFDSISAGILMYTGLVELLAHEFMFNPHMRKSPLRIQLFAFGCVLFGAAVMAVLANWA